MSIVEKDHKITGEFLEVVNGRPNLFARWRISNGVIGKDSAAFDLTMPIETNYTQEIPLMSGRHVVFKNLHKRFVKSGVVMLKVGPGKYISSSLNASRISSKSPNKYGGILPVIDLPDIPFLIVAILAVISIVINWRHLEMSARFMSTYPLLAFALAFQPDNPNFAFDPKFSIIYQVFYGLLDWILYTMIAIYFYIIMKGKSIRVRILISVALFMLLGRVGYSSKVEGSYDFVSPDKVIESMLVVYLSLTFFWRILAQGQQDEPEKDRTFWIVAVCFIYFVASFFISGFIKLFSIMNKPILSDWNYLAHISRSLLFLAIIVLCFVKFPKTINE